MAAATYRVTSLKADETDTAELLGEAALLDRFAPEIANTTTLGNSQKATEWLKAFLTIEVLQSAQGVKVDKVDAREIFEARLEEFTTLEDQAKRAKNSLGEALLSVLSDVTDEDLEKGEYRTVSKNAKNKVGEVEYYVTKAKPDLKKLIAGSGSFPEAVREEINRIHKDRASAAAKRFSNKA